MNIAIFLLTTAILPIQSDTLRLSLDQAVARALDANPALLAQEAASEARSQLPLQASAAFLPTVSFGVQGMRTTDPVAVFGLKLRQENFANNDLSLESLNRPSPYSGYSASATVQVPILVPEGLYGFQAARNAARAGEAQASATRSPAGRGP
jgi:outer membrane protein TolC